MALWLKQSTSVTVKIGPFVDSTDGVTAETGLTISQADIRLTKNGGNAAQSNDTGGGTHDENGWYDITLDATDTNTLGRLQVFVNESGALPVWHEFMVVPSNVWDSFFGADRLQVDVREKGDSTLGLTTQEKTDVDAEVDEAIENYGLDHLVAAAVTGPDVANNSIFAMLVSKSATADWDDYVNTTDSLQAIRDQGDSAWITATGFSTHSAADVWTSGTRTLTGAVDLNADQSSVTIGTVTSNTDMRGTDGAYTGTPPTAAAIAAAVMAEVVENSLDVTEVLRLILAANAGKLSGAASTTVAIRDTADSKTRISATVDEDGNRTAVTLDAS